MDPMTQISQAVIIVLSGFAIFGLIMLAWMKLEDRKFRHEEKER